jgi:hypothetical protein
VRPLQVRRPQATAEAKVVTVTNGPKTSSRCTRAPGGARTMVGSM